MNALTNGKKPSDPLRRCGAAAVFLLALCVPICDAPAADAPQRLVVVSDINYPPYMFVAESGELQGILKDKWALWSRQTGVPVEVKGMLWATAQKSVLNGDADVIDALSYSE